MKNLTLTYSAYFVKCRKPLLFQDYVKREDDAGIRMILPSKVAELLNSANIIPIFLSSQSEKRNALLWATMTGRNGDLSGFVKDLEDAEQRALLFGEEPHIRFWEKEFLQVGVRILRYEIPSFSKEEVFYLTSNKVVSIGDYLIAKN